MSAAKDFEQTFWLGIMANPCATLSMAKTLRVDYATKRDAYAESVKQIDRLLAENAALDKEPF
jgi:hypothetical protein